MKLELLKDKTKDEIADIWRQYHANKEEAVAAVIPADIFKVMSQRFQEHKTVRAAKILRVRISHKNFARPTFFCKPVKSF